MFRPSIALMYQTATHVGQLDFSLKVQNNTHIYDLTFEKYWTERKC